MISILLLLLRLEPAAVLGPPWFSVEGRGPDAVALASAAAAVVSTLDAVAVVATASSVMSMTSGSFAPPLGLMWSMKFSTTLAVREAAYSVGLGGRSLGLKWW